MKKYYCVFNTKGLSFVGTSADAAASAAALDDAGTTIIKVVTDVNQATELLASMTFLTEAIRYFPNDVFRELAPVDKSRLRPLITRLDCPYRYHNAELTADSMDGETPLKKLLSGNMR
jgi:hypothetical protein